MIAHFILTSVSVKVVKWWTVNSSLETVLHELRNSRYGVSLLSQETQLLICKVGFIPFPLKLYSVTTKLVQESQNTKRTALQGRPLFRGKFAKITHKSSEQALYASAVTPIVFSLTQRVYSDTNMSMSGLLVSFSTTFSGFQTGRQWKRATVV